MRVALILASALLAMGVCPASAAKLNTIKVGEWSGGAYSNDTTKKFSHCAATAHYRSGIFVTMMVNREYNWGVGFLHPEWQLKQGSKFELAYMVDAGEARPTTATAISANQVLIGFGGNVERFREFNDQWFYYAKSGDEHPLHSSSLSVPWGIPGPVVLDATARAEFLWDLLEDKSFTVPTPSHVRDYSSVTLHVARESGVGKRTMTAKFKSRLLRLASDVEARLPPNSSVFLCTHKDNAGTARHIGMGFERLAVGHWGAIDGRNDWSEYDTAVIFGLPYRDQNWANNTFFATQGVQSDEWLKAPAWGVHKDVRRVMQQRQLSVSIIQAINRVRLRRVVDSEGRCPGANVFIILPKDRDGDAILNDILKDMPGLNISDWDFKMDGPKVLRPRKGSFHEALVAFMETRLPGRTPFSMLTRELSPGASALKKLPEALRDETHPLATALSAMGVEYLVEGAGRGRKSFLVKHHAA